MLKRGMFIGLAVAGLMVVGACSSEDVDTTDGSGGNDSSAGSGADSGDNGGSNNGGADGGSAGSDGGDCRTCIELTQGATQADLCEPSLAIASTVIECACQPDNCLEECGGADGCGMPENISGACQVCLGAACGDQLNACINDDGMAGGTGGMGGTGGTDPGGSGGEGGDAGDGGEGGDAGSAGMSTAGSAGMSSAGSAGMGTAGTSAGMAGMAGNAGSAGTP